MTIHPDLTRLIKASRAARGTAVDDMSRQIAAHLGPDIERLGLHWQIDPDSPRRRPSLHAMPDEGTYEEEHAQFVTAVAALTDGHVETSTNRHGTVTYSASTRLAGVDVWITTVVWGYDNPDQYTPYLTGASDH